MKTLSAIIFSIFTIALSAQGTIIEKDNIYTLSIADLSFSVDANKGGRITSFQRAGKEMLLQQDVHPVYYGATFWPSPQKDFWPPSPNLDKNPYSVEVSENLLRLTSAPDTLLGFRFIKEFSCLPDTSISINYIIKNISNKEKQVAPWDVTRVVAGGCTYFLIDEMLENSLQNIAIKNDTLAYTFVPDTFTAKQKLFATVKEGWLAHQNNDLLFIKKFPKTSKEDLPPLQGTVELFLALNNQYIELENHGKYTNLKPGEKLHYKQQWLLFDYSKILLGFNP